jgi:hypothetical protein
MGCDIHMYVEKKVKGKWVKVGDVFDNPYYEPEGPDYSWNTPKTDQPYSGRNYNLFAILADVRNGYGFAGCDTGDAVEPIDYPRGLPHDVSKEIQVCSDEWGVDGHSHSHFTIREILDHNWTTKKTHRGWVGRSGYEEFLENGEPSGWSGGISGGGVKHVINKEMDRMIREGEDTKNVYTKIEWTTEQWEDCRYFLNTVKKIRAMFEEGGTDLDDVRLVFWFDN